MSKPVEIHTDGASRGNPGPAAFAFVMRPPEGEPGEQAGPLGSATNNFAEYTALIRALAAANEHGHREVVIFSDSELMVKQLNGIYRVKNEQIKPLFEEAKSLIDRLSSVEIKHVRREANKRADELCNLVLDGKWGDSGEASPGSKPATRAPKAPGKSVTDERVRDDAVECLRTAARSWAEAGPSYPKPEDVWEQLWFILDEGGVLKKK